jgi:SRSO17 transposase
LRLIIFNLIKFPANFRIYYQEEGKKMLWQYGKKTAHRKKYDLAIEVLKQALEMGFPRGTVPEDFWF